MKPIRQIIREEAVKGLITGICIGLTITFVAGLLGVLLASFCILPFAPWCP
jgi:hypothetical protein